MRKAQSSFLGDLLDSAPEAMAITHDGLAAACEPGEFVRLFGYARGGVHRTVIIDAMLLPEGRLHENEILHHMVMDGWPGLD